MSYSRQKVVAQAQAWLGKKESDGSFKEIIDLYNSHKPLARGYKVKYTDEWCATFVSAVAIKLGYTSIMPTECGCGKMIDLYKNLGCWIEDENRTPKAGDIIFYDWQDNGVGDNKGVADHVGIVEKVVGKTITVIEGNKNEAVARRTIAVNGKFIRGYAVPKYNKETTSTITSTTTSKPQEDTSVKEVTATGKAKKYSKNLAGSYKTTANLNMRNDAGTSNKSLVVIPKGTIIKCYGYYSISNSAVWYYAQVTLNGVVYTGFCHSSYLAKV